MTTRRRMLILSAAFAALWTASPAAAQTDPQRASAFVEGVIAEGLGVIKSDGAAADQRRAALRALVERSFDIESVSGYVLGRFKNRLTPEQRIEFRELYLRYVMAIYFNRLAAVGDVRVAIAGTQPQTNGDVVVETAIFREGAANPLNVGWRVRETGNQSRLLDIQTEGVSLAVTQRSEFTAVLRANDYDGLVEAMERQIARAGTP